MLISHGESSDLPAQEGYPDLKTSSLFSFVCSSGLILHQILASQVSEMLEDKESHLGLGGNSHAFLCCNEFFLNIYG